MVVVALGYFKGHDHHADDEADNEKKAFVVAHGIYQGATGALGFRVGGQEGQAHDQPEYQYRQYQGLGIHPLISPFAARLVGHVI